ncbi:MAG TPA: RHS repeat-associated core domain-containing protein [Verrucomicrobiae bacterium]|nr:RHS repeat-associated core domain-containing protein [Verrucomicrobiae bacterium]
MTSVTVSNAWRSEFAYDGKMRRRVRREFTWSGSDWSLTNLVEYVYDGNVVLQELWFDPALTAAMGQTLSNATNTPEKLVTYTRGLDLSGSFQGVGGVGGLLALTAAWPSGKGFSAYYHSDGNGNITCMVNTNNQIVAQYLYDPFGNLISKSGWLADANLYRFSSKEAHLNSGLVYYLYRYYAPMLQRWVNRDPLASFAGQHEFRIVGYLRTGGTQQQWVAHRNLHFIVPACFNYCRNAPLGYFDPLGLWTFSVGVSIGITIGPINVTVSAGVTGDTQGNFAGYGTAGGGAAIGAGIAAGVTCAISNAKDNSDLNGPFGSASVGGGFGPDASGDVFWGNSPDGPVIGGGGTVGVGLGGGASVDLTGTKIHPL